MDFDSDKIIATELDWVYRNEPTFQVNGNVFIGKIGRTPEGEDIQLRILVPEFYPIVKPDVNILNNISHPNIRSDGKLDLQLLDEWEPHYKLKDIISASRRLFISYSSRASLSSPSTKTTPSGIEKEINDLQVEIANYNRQINELKGKQLRDAGIKSAAVGSLKISKKIDLDCLLQALQDLLELLEVKFEEAEITQIDFFRLYRRYVREYHLTNTELRKLQGNDYELSTKTKRPITS